MCGQRQRTLGRIADMSTGIEQTRHRIGGDKLRDALIGGQQLCQRTVSYTHLDVYKRQREGKNPANGVDVRPSHTYHRNPSCPATNSRPR